MDLVDSLGSDTHARSVAELSLSILFPRDHTSLYKAVDDLQLRKAIKNLAQLGAHYLPSLWKGKFRLLGIDTTPNPRPYAFKLWERECVYKPTPIKGQIPITYGHSYSNINVLPGRQSPHAPSWAPPQSTRRVRRQDQEQQTIAQFRALLEI